MCRLLVLHIVETSRGAVRPQFPDVLWGIYGGGPEITSLENCPLLLPQFWEKNKFFGGFVAMKG